MLLFWVTIFLYERNCSGLDANRSNVFTSVRQKVVDTPTCVNFEGLKKMKNSWSRQYKYWSGTVYKCLYKKGTTVINDEDEKIQLELEQKIEAYGGLKFLQELFNWNRAKIWCWNRAIYDLQGKNRSWTRSEKSQKQDSLPIFDSTCAKTFGSLKSVLKFQSSRFKRS